MITINYATGKRVCGQTVKLWHSRRFKSPEAADRFLAKLEERTDVLEIIRTLYLAPQKAPGWIAK